MVKSKPFVCALAFALTIILLLFPTRLQLAYHPLGSLFIFNSLQIFAFFFVAWSVLVAVVLISRDVSKLFPVLLFASIFYSFWSIKTGALFSVDGVIQLIDVNHVLQTGAITPNNPLYGYFDYPVIHFFAAESVLLTGIRLISFAEIFVILRGLLFSVLLYVLYKRLIPGDTFPSIATLLILEGNIVLSRLNFFHPDAFVLIFFMMFLFFKFGRHGSVESRTTGVVTTLLLVAAIGTNYVTSLLMLSISFALWAVGKRGWSTWSYQVGFPLVLFASWNSWFSYSTFGWVLAQVFQTGNLGEYLSELFRTTVGPEIPLWASFVRTFWFVFLTIPGLLLSLIPDRRAGGHRLKTTKLSIVLISTFLFCAVASLFGGSVQVYRFLEYVPFFSLPVLLLYLQRFHIHDSHVFGFFVVLFLVLSLPTFLANNDRVSIDAYYPVDYSISRFAATQASGSVVYADGSMAPYLVFYGVPITDVRIPPIGSYVTTSGAWIPVETWFSQFGESRAAIDTAILVSFQRLVIAYQRDLGISPNDSHWIQLDAAMSSHSLVYNNGGNQIYY